MDTLEKMCWTACSSLQRGKNAPLGNPKNVNFLGIVALSTMSRWQSILERLHLKNPPYLAWCTQNEFLDSLSEGVVGRSKPPSTSQWKWTAHQIFQSNSRPQLSHVHTDEKKEVTDAVLWDKTGAGLTDTLAGVLGSLGLGLANCRGQNYDSDPNMRGIHEGVQRLGSSPAVAAA